MFLPSFIIFYKQSITSSQFTVFLWQNINIRFIFSPGNIPYPFPSMKYGSSIGFLRSISLRVIPNCVFFIFTIASGLSIPCFLEIINHISNLLFPLFVWFCARSFHYNSISKLIGQIIRFLQTIYILSPIGYRQRMEIALVALTELGGNKNNAQTRIGHESIILYKGCTFGHGWLICFQKHYLSI